MSPELQADYALWLRRKGEADEKLAAKGGTFEQVRETLIRTFQQLPEDPVVPKELTREGQRMDSFKSICPVEFLKPVQQSLLANPGAFEAVRGWNGQFPGPLAAGATGTAKTRAAWCCAGRLYVREGKPFMWAPIRKLLSELARDEENHELTASFRRFSHFPFLFIDDLDKFNMDFNSQASALFAFYDWAYSNKKPIIATTNQNKGWWSDRLGDAFARRLFDDAHAHVQF